MSAACSGRDALAAVGCGVGSFLDIPLHLLILLGAALDGGAHAADVAVVAGSAPDPVNAAIVVRAHANPLQFGAEAFYDALSGLRGDQRFARYVSRVFKTSSGVAYVPTKADARTTLALRSEPVIARHVAQRYAEANAQALAIRLGRVPRLGDLYLAHRAGLRLAIEFHERLAQRPGALAAIEIPDLDEAAPELLFAGERATTLADIAAQLERVTTSASRRSRVSATSAAPRKKAASSGRTAPVTQVMGWHAEVTAQHPVHVRDGVRVRRGDAIPER